MKHTPIIVAREALENDPEYIPGHLFNPNLDHALYVVTWPEHVRSPKYNGDAAYHAHASIEVALMAWPNANVDHNSIDILGPLARNRWLATREQDDGDTLIYLGPHGHSATLTANSSASSYGIPVLRLQGEGLSDALDLGPGDLMPSGILADEFVRMALGDLPRPEADAGAWQPLTGDNEGLARKFISAL